MLRKIAQAIMVGLASTVTAVVMHHLIGSPVVPVAVTGFVIGLVS